MLPSQMRSKVLEMEDRERLMDATSNKPACLLLQVAVNPSSTADWKQVLCDSSKMISAVLVLRRFWSSQPLEA